MNLMLAFMSASDKCSKIQGRSQQVWIDICSEMSGTRMAQVCAPLFVPPVGTMMSHHHINKTKTTSESFSFLQMPHKEVFRQGQYGLRLSLEQESVVVVTKDKKK